MLKKSRSLCIYLFETSKNDCLRTISITYLTVPSKVWPIFLELPITVWKVSKYGEIWTKKIFLFGRFSPSAYFNNIFHFKRVKYANYKNRGKYWLYCRLKRTITSLSQRIKTNLTHNLLLFKTQPIIYK